MTQSVQSTELFTVPFLISYRALHLSFATISLKFVLFLTANYIFPSKESIVVPFIFIIGWSFGGILEERNTFRFSFNQIITSLLINILILYSLLFFYSFPIIFNIMSFSIALHSGVLLIRLYKNEVFSKILFSDLLGVILAYSLIYFFLGIFHLESILLGVIFLLTLNLIKEKKLILIYSVVGVSCLISQQRTFIINFKNLKSLQENVERTPNKPLRNGVLAEKAKLVDYLYSRWSLHERVDVYHEKQKDEYIFYVNNKAWTKISVNLPYFWFLSVLKKGDSLFDIGTGTGQIISYAHTKGLKATGIELNEATYRLVKDMFPDHYKSLKLAGEYIFGEGVYHLRNSAKKYDMISLLFSNYSAQNISEVLQKEKVFTLDGMEVALSALSKNGILIYRTKDRKAFPSYITNITLKNIMAIRNSTNPNIDYFLIHTQRGTNTPYVNTNIIVSPSKIGPERKGEFLDFCAQELQCEINNLNEPEKSQLVHWDKKMVLNTVHNEEIIGKPIHFYLKLILPTMIFVLTLFFLQRKKFSFTFTSLTLGILYGGLQSTYIIILRDSFHNTFMSYYFVTFIMLISSIIAIIVSKYVTKIRLRLMLFGLFFFTILLFFITDTVTRLTLLSFFSFFSTSSFYYLLKRSKQNLYQMVIVSNNLGFILSYLVSLIYITLYL
ncbi:MAG: hypothetical protein K9K67_13880 [Bacteriovoracaceae bacterium]|nr:hypothetical protein [Bacteriovoracaceae bacterium]